MQNALLARQGKRTGGDECRMPATSEHERPVRPEIVRCKNGADGSPFAVGGRNAPLSPANLTTPDPALSLFCCDPPLLCLTRQAEPA